MSPMEETKEQEKKEERRARSWPCLSPPREKGEKIDKERRRRSKKVEAQSFTERSLEGEGGGPRRNKMTEDGGSIGSVGPQKRNRGTGQGGNHGGAKIHKGI